MKKRERGPSKLNMYNAAVIHNTKYILSWFSNTVGFLRADTASLSCTQQNLLINYSIKRTETDRKTEYE